MNLNHRTRKESRESISNIVCLNLNEIILKQNQRNVLPSQVERERQMFNIRKKTEERRQSFFLSIGCTVEWTTECREMKK